VLLFYAGLCVICLAAPHLSTLSHKWQDIREKGIQHKIRVLIFSTILKFSHSKKNSARYYFKYTEIIM